MAKPRASAELIDAVTGMISDEIGDRLYHQDSALVPQLHDWRQTGPNQADLWLVDGTHLRITVTDAS